MLDPDTPVPSHRRMTLSTGVLAEFEAAALRSDFFASCPLQAAGGACELAHYLFEGPPGGGEPIRLGLFAGIHGDEPEGTRALVRLAQILADNPRLGAGYHLHLYPVCNPTGFDLRTRLSGSGKDLNREFWRGSAEPEVAMLEREIERQTFHGLVSLHADDTSDGLYGFVRGDVLARSLLDPALRAAEKVLPRNRRPVIDGFPAENGVICRCYEGILASPPRLLNTPFEIIFETPHQAPAEKQIEAYVRAMLSIFEEYRKFIAFAADL